MCSVEDLGSSELSQFGPPTQWSIDDQLGWVLDHATIGDIRDLDLSGEPRDTPSGEPKDFEGDGSVEMENTKAGFDFFLSLEDLAVDPCGDETEDQCPATLRGCAVASADMPGGQEMLQIVDRMEADMPGDQTTKLLPAPANATTDPSTPQARVKRGSNSSSPGSCEKAEPPQCSQKRYRITLSPEHWAKKINGANAAPEAGNEPWTSPVDKTDRFSKMRGRDLWIKARMQKLDGKDAQMSYKSQRDMLRSWWPGFPEDFKAAWAQFYDAKQNDNQAAAPPLYVDAFHEKMKLAQQLAVSDPKDQGGVPAPSVDEFDGPPASRVHGYMLTWHGKWGRDNSAAQALCGRDLPLQVMVAAVKANPFY